MTLLFALINRSFLIPSKESRLNDNQLLIVSCHYANIRAYLSVCKSNFIVRYSDVSISLSLPAMQTSFKIINTSLSESFQLPRWRREPIKFPLSQVPIELKFSLLSFPYLISFPVPLLSPFPSLYFFF